MLIYVVGNDSLLAKQAIDQIKAKYLEKNPGGAELVEIDESTVNPNWADLAAVPLFATSRLVIIRRAGLFGADSQRQLAHVLAAMTDSTNVIVWDGKAVDTEELQQSLAAAAKTIEVKTPAGAALERWIGKRAKELGVTLSAEDIQNLTEASASDLWRVETELGQLVLGLASQKRGTAASEPFVFFNLIRRGNWDAIKRELAAKVAHGEPIELVLGSLAAAVRKELKDRSSARALADLFIDVDLGLKTGFLEPESAVAVIVSNLPQPSSNRVQWEATWEEAYSGR